MLYKINQFTLLLCLTAFLSLSCKKDETTSNLDKVVIIKYEQSKIYDKVEMGIIDQLNTSGIKLDIINYNAKGSEESLISALNEAKKQQPLAVLTISEIATMTALNLLKTNNTIFFGIFNVDEINKIYRYNNKNNNIRGLYKVKNIKPYIKKMKNILNNVESVGYLYNINTVDSIEKSRHLRNAFIEEGLEYRSLPIITESDITNSYSNTFNKIDAIYLDSDKLTLTAIGYISPENIKYLPPIITTHNMTSYNNIALSININYYRAGRMLADMLIELKEKRNLNEVRNRKIEENFDIYINKTVLDNINIKLNTNNLNINTKIIYVKNSF